MNLAAWNLPPVFQSTRTVLYQEARNQLVRRNLAYPCGCSRQQIDQAAGEMHKQVDQAAEAAGAPGDQVHPVSEVEVHRGLLRSGARGQVRASDDSSIEAASGGLPEDLRREFRGLADRLLEAG